MTKVYLIRHAEAEGNLKRVMQGHQESNLTHRGELQVKALCERFRGIHVDAIYSSDLKRARETAAAVSRANGDIEIQTKTRLREICVGDWEGKHLSEILKNEPELFEDFAFRMDIWNVPGAERPLDVQDRAWDCVTELAESNSGRVIAVVSHGYLLRLFMARAMGISLRDAGKELQIGGNTCVSLYEYEDGHFTPVFTNDQSHLSDELRISGARALDPAPMESV